MLFYCLNEVRVEIACSLNGHAFDHARLPDPGSLWRFSPRGTQSADAFGEPAMASATRQSFCVTDPESGLEYVIIVSQMTGTDGARAVYFSFPDGLPPRDRSLTVLDTQRGTERRGDALLDPAAILCFSRGTMIRTPSGEIPVEMLLVGDMVSTRDNGAQTIRWIGSRMVEAAGAFAPVAFAPGSIGNSERLLVSPRHRVVMPGRDGLVAAIDLLNGTTITQASGGRIEYFNLVFDRHEVVFAHDALTEAFNPLANCLEPGDEESRAEVMALFPEYMLTEDGYGAAAAGGGFDPA